jgi:uncharacterized protein YdeI (YjbR/CyaY-like superfamily)
MQVTTTFKPGDRPAWRAWLERNQRTASEIWLLLDDRPEEPTVSYLDAVEEAICFGWIDGIQKRFSTHERAQRFTPRKPRSNWTELNKERARRLIRLGLMTEAGRAALPDLTAPHTVAADIVAALQAEPDAWPHFLAFAIFTAGCASGILRRRAKTRTVCAPAEQLREKNRLQPDVRQLE